MLTSVDRQTFTVKNVGNASKSFKLSHIPAGTALTFQPGTIFPADGPVPLSTSAASIKFSETSFTVHPGQTQEITAHISPPTGLDPTTFPVFSGFIGISNAEESYLVSYLGSVGLLKDVQVVDDTDVFFGVTLPVLTDSAGNFLLNATNFRFVGDDFPTVLMCLAFGTPKLLFDLVEPDVRLKTTLNKRGNDSRCQAPKWIGTWTWRSIENLSASGKPVRGVSFELPTNVREAIPESVLRGHLARCPVEVEASGYDRHLLFRSEALFPHRTLYVEEEEEEWVYVEPARPGEVMSAKEQKAEYETLLAKRIAEKKEKAAAVKASHKKAVAASA
ncbi:hypothetical protein NUW54_g11932 [Trametes sanguinea]|uniref:Uncharacterized protein n=1 Tax=Trametes sanguinea TaxID=158606 RepID=A0ACC1N6U7_9APHY|nr:hypothetical protein NUW54_g11932 [Trametes sanguinea]